LTGKFRKICIVLLIAAVLFHRPLLKKYFILDYRQTIIDFSRDHRMNPALVSAIVFTESGFNPAAESHKGAVGLMQIMPATGQWVAEQMMLRNFTLSELTDPDINLKIGIWYLAYLKQYFHENDYLALASYNAGHRYVSGWVENGIWNGDTVKIEQIPFPETKKYVLKVLLLKKVYGYLYPELS
jgi:soluble lytic murein transglycosylase